jgi:hypothetical protein
MLNAARRVWFCVRNLRLARATSATSAMGAVAMSFAIGCTAVPSEPALLTVPHAQYDRAFDAACEIARAEGFVPEIADRNAGAIESEPKFAGSVIEPWAWDDMQAADVASGTFGFERRRVRFEFLPAGFRPTAPEGTAPLAGPILPGSERGRGANIAGAAGELEVRVSVSVERQFRPGYQGGAYTRALGSYSRDTTLKDDPTTPRDRSTWTAVGRDERLERMLIERLADRLASAADVAAKQAE